MFESGAYSVSQHVPVRRSTRPAHRSAFGARLCRSEHPDLVRALRPTVPCCEGGIQLRISVIVATRLVRCNALTINLLPCYNDVLAKSDAKPKAKAPAAKRATAATKKSAAAKKPKKAPVKRKGM